MLFLLIQKSFKSYIRRLHLTPHYRKKQNFLFEQCSKPNIYSYRRIIISVGGTRFRYCSCCCLFALYFFLFSYLSPSLSLPLYIKNTKTLYLQSSFELSLPLEKMRSILWHKICFLLKSVYCFKWKKWSSLCMKSPLKSILTQPTPRQTMIYIVGSEPWKLTLPIQIKILMPCKNNWNWKISQCSNFDQIVDFPPTRWRLLDL